jgi:hypothetical protein
VGVPVFWKIDYWRKGGMLAKVKETKGIGIEGSTSGDIWYVRI